MERRHRAGPADERDLAVAGTTSSPLAPDAATLLLLSSAAGNAAVGSLLRGVQRLPDDELVAEHHTVTPVVSTTPGVATTGSVSETELPGGRTVVGTATDTRVAGVPVARERSVVTEETDEFAVRRAREAGEEVDPDALPTRVVGGTRRTSAVGTTGVTSTTTTTAEEAGGVVDRTRRTTVGPSGVTRARSTTLTETDPAAGTRTTSENAGSTSVGLGGVSSTSTESTSTTNVYGDVESSSTARTTSLTAGGGRVSVGRSRTDVAEERVGDFGTRSERTTTTSASAIHGAEGSGVGLARSMAATTTTGGVELGRRASADGSFTVNVERLDDRDPPRFRITLRVHVGVAAGASAGRHLEEEAAGVTGSGGVSGSVAGDLVYERVYSESEARGYLGDLHQIESGRSADGRPEYGLLARMRAARAAGSATPAAIVSATDARAMREGDAVDLDLSASGDLTLGAGGRTAAGTGPGASPRGSVGVELSGGVTTGRRLRVARSSSAVEVTLTVRASTRASGSGTLGYGVASMTGGMGGSEGESVSMVFRLDPANAEEFDRLFGELSTIMTEEGLRSFAESHPALLRSRTDTASTSSTESIGMGVGPASLSGTTTSTLEASTTRAEGRVTGTRSGSQATTGSLGVGGRTVLSGTHTTGAEATVAASDDDATVAELTATITTSEAETDYAAGLEAVARPFRERRAEDAIAGAVATGPSGLLEQLLNTTTTRLQELDLDTASVDRLIERARERDTWGRAISRYQLIEPWEALRRGLTSPRPQREWLEADRSPDHRWANRLAQATALTTFMASWGERGGGPAIQWVLREWGGGTGFDMTIATSEDIGTLREWPPSLRRTRERFNRFRGMADGLNRRLEGLIPTSGAADDSAVARGRALGDEIVEGLTTVRQEIEACEDFETPRAKLEMTLEIQRIVRETRARVTRFEGMVSRRASTARTGGEASASEATAGAAASSEATTLDEAERVCRGPEGAAAADPALVGRLNDTLAALRRSKADERSGFARAADMLSTEIGGTVEWAVWRLDRSAAIDVYNQLAELHEGWLAVVADVRQLYRSIGTPESEWLVRPSASARPRSLDPDIDGLCDRYTRLCRSMTFAPIGWQEIAAQWRARGRR